MLEEAGVPVWVTELDVNMDDFSDCAQAYEDLLRVLFSHPVVEGIIMWGFWDEDHLFPFCPHVVGENLTVSWMFHCRVNTRRSDVKHAECFVWFDDLLRHYPNQ